MKTVYILSLILAMALGYMACLIHTGIQKQNDIEKGLITYAE